jgi:hypothetical protein
MKGRLLFRVQDEEDSRDVEETRAHLGGIQDLLDFSQRFVVIPGGLQGLQLCLHKDFNVP